MRPSCGSSRVHERGSAHDVSGGKETLTKGPTLVSYIEWENFRHKWKIEKLEPSESLPRGAEKAEVWRDDDYKTLPCGKTSSGSMKPYDATGCPESCL